jgi:hypothetical protein
MEAVPYREAVGSLMYLMVGTRPDIAYSVSVASRYLSNPGPKHWLGVKRIMRYLKGTIDYGLCFSFSEKVELVGFSDADWAGDLDSRKSTTGYVFTLSGGPVSWTSKRQNTVALSSTEAEYMAVTMTGREAVWLRTLLQQLGFTMSRPTLIHVDNQSCTALAQNPVHHQRTKHIDIQHHFVRELVSEKVIELKYVPTEENIADVFTKGLGKQRHHDLLTSLLSV